MPLELKLEEVVGDLGSTLTRKDEHLVPAYGYWEVAARRRDLTALIDLMDTKAEARDFNTYRALLVCMIISMFFWL